jgi:predicted DNA binding CopG/RHH family protein
MLDDYDDSSIDYSDIPAQTDEDLKQFVRLGRPLAEVVKQMIAIRLDPTLLKKLKKEAAHQGIGYQTLIQQILAKHFKKKKTA